MCSQETLTKIHIVVVFVSEITQYSVRKFFRLFSSFKKWADLDYILLMQTTGSCRGNAFSPFFPSADLWKLQEQLFIGHSTEAQQHRIKPEKTGLTNAALKESCFPDPPQPCRGNYWYTITHLRGGGKRNCKNKKKGHWTPAQARDPENNKTKAEASSEAELLGTSCLRISKSFSKQTAAQNSPFLYLTLCFLQTHIPL